VAINPPPFQYQCLALDRCIGSSPRQTFITKERVARDKNFAGQLSLLDLLFGTAHMPRDQVPSQYGIDEPLPSTYVMQLLHPFLGDSSVSRRAIVRPETHRRKIDTALLREERT
jgi:hypothetical protein